MSIIVIGVILAVLCTLLGNKLVITVFSMGATFGVGVIIEIILKAFKQHDLGQMAKYATIMLCLYYFFCGIEGNVNDVKEGIDNFKSKFQIIERVTGK